MPPKRRAKGKKAVVGKKVVESTPVPAQSALAILPPEIWRLIGELIRGPKTLQSLVLVCRDFRVLYTPSLFRERMYRLHMVDPKRPRYMSLPPGLEHIKELSAFVDEFMDGDKRRGVPYDSKLNDNYGRYLGRLINSIPNLESFKWNDRSLEEYRTAAIARNKTLLTALKAAPKLKELYLSFESIYLYDSNPLVHNLFIPLDGFRNLTSFEIYNFFGKQIQLVRDLGAFLSRCPGLKTLGLGLSCDADCNNFPESMVMAGGYDFLEKLCVSYGAERTTPLSLDTLRLGWGMCVFESVEVETGNFLDRLFKAQDLRVLHLFNGFVRLGSLWSDPEYMQIDWDLLNGCSSLEQLSISRLDENAKNWLNENATHVKELIFPDTYAMDGTAQLYLSKLERPLTLLFAIEDGAHSIRDTSDPRYWSDSDDSDDDSLCSACGLIHPNESVTSSSSSSDSDSNTNSENDLDSEDGFVAEEGNSIQEHKSKEVQKFVPEKISTVLDRLQDGGSHLTHLALALDPDVQWTHFTSRLARLKNLTHLHVRHRSWRFGQWPHSQLSKWPGVTKPVHIAYRYAQEIKKVCPSIQFIRFENWVWQFVAQRDVSKIRAKDPSTQYEMIPMEWAEVFEILLFAIDPINTQTGLPGRDLDAPFSDEEWERIEEMDKKVKARRTMVESIL